MVNNFFICRESIIFAIDTYNMTITTLFPEFDEWTRVIFSPAFIAKCTDHARSLGYVSRSSNDRLCIISANGESSCTPGTLVGWAFVNEIEEYISKNGFPWFTATDRSQAEVSKGFAIAGQLSNIISENLKEE